jgi:hypothetical protein
VGQSPKLVLIPGISVSQLSSSEKWGNRWCGKKLTFGVKSVEWVEKTECFEIQGKDGNLIKFKVPKLLSLGEMQSFVSSEQVLSCLLWLLSLTPGWTDAGNYLAVLLNGNGVKWFSNSHNSVKARTLIFPKLRSIHVFPVEIRNKSWKIHSHPPGI